MPRADATRGSIDTVDLPPTGSLQEQVATDRFSVVSQ